MPSLQLKRPRYRFGDFIVSPSRRILLRSGRELPLIPRYFDLLLLLLERRREAVHRREILDAVWSDVVVSDGALTQAVRILRRTLGDDSREPAFIRTVSRHGYQFAFADVFEEPDSDTLPKEAPRATTAAPTDIERELERLLQSEDEFSRRDAAEALHTLGTAEALKRLGRRPGHEAARALLRETRWDLPEAEDVPVVGEPGALVTLKILLGQRFKRALPLIFRRWVGAILGGATSGLIAGITGGLLLHFGPDSQAPPSVVVALALVGLMIGGVGATGVGGGLAVAEAVIRSARGVALVALGAFGGGLVGSAAHLLGRWTLEGLFGRDLSPVAGGFEGFVLGGAAGLGYALATPTPDGGMATPHGLRRWLSAFLAGLTCALAAAGLASTGSFLGAMSLDFMAHSFPGSQVGLEPLAHLLGEATPGVLTRTVISAWEGVMFGSGVVLGLTRRPLA